MTNLGGAGCWHCVPLYRGMEIWPWLNRWGYCMASCTLHAVYVVVYAHGGLAYLSWSACYGASNDTGENDGEIEN